MAEAGGEDAQILLNYMEKLWFNHSILSKPISVFIPKSPDPVQASPSSPLNLCSTPLPLELKKSQSLNEKKIVNEEQRSSKSVNLYSESKKHIEAISDPGKKNCRRGRLMKMNSCKSLSELEYDELKGFMDLGFIFKEENINPRMMSVVPGLQRLGKSFNDDTEDSEKRTTVRRPYLSESWLISRPDSPLLHLRLPSPSAISPVATTNMKKQLKYWAKTVASEIHHESLHSPKTHFAY